MKGKRMRLYKRIVSIALALFMVMGLMPVMPVEVQAAETMQPVTVEVDGETVTLQDTDADGYYEIGTAAELDAFRTLVKEQNDAYGTMNAELTADIDYNPGYTFAADGTVTYTNENGDSEIVTEGWKEWAPIGRNSVSLEYYGSFDGNGHTISGLYHKAGTETGTSIPLGLFGYVKGELTIEDVGVVNSFFSGNDATGAIVGWVDSEFPIKILNCYSEATIKTSGGDAGGIVGRGSKTSIINCYNTGTVEATSAISEQYVGGIVGWGNIITNCYNTGTVKATIDGGSANSIGQYVGGIVGYRGTTITNCYNVGDIEATIDSESATSKRQYVGGIVGFGKTTTITNCYNTGIAEAGVERYGNSDRTEQNVGGIVGYGDTTTITNCYYNIDNYYGEIHGASGNVTVDAASSGMFTEQFASGEVTYLLNGKRCWKYGSDEDLIWYQTLSGDNPQVTPQFSNTSKDVVHCYVDGENSTYKNHTHEIKYAVGENNELLQSCDKHCDEIGGSVCVNAPTNPIYNGNRYEATIDKSENFRGNVPTIVYKDADGNKLTDAPTNVGTYTAEISMDGFPDVIASVGFSISYLPTPIPAYEISNGFKIGDVYWFGVGSEAIVEAPDGYTITDSLNRSFGSSVSFSYDVAEKSIWLKNSNEEQTDEIDLTNILKWDVTAPVGSISISTDNVWTNLLAHIGFTHFFGVEKTVTISAADSESGMASVEYYVADALPENNVQDFVTSIASEDWKPYSQAISLSLNSKNVVYAKLTDNVGNVSYISSEGIVLYSESTVTSTADREYKAGTDLDVEYSGNGNTLAAILYNGQPLNNGLFEDYTIGTDADVVTFTRAFLDSLDAGTHELTFVFHPQGVATDAVSLTETLTLTVTPAPLTIVGATATEKDYDGTKEVIITGLTLDGIKDTDSVGVSFEKLMGSVSSANAGTYTSVALGEVSDLIVLTGDDADNYELVYTSGTEVVTNVTIHKVVATVVTAPVANRLTYNASAQDLVTAGVTSDGIIRYSLSENGTYATEIPAATNAGNYTVWYYVEGDENHNDSTKASIAVNIDKATPVFGTVSATIPDNSIVAGDIVLHRTDSTFAGSLNLIDAGQSLVWGENEIAYAFTPVDTDNYKVVTGKVTVVVKDTVVPTVAYRIGTDAWKEFVNTVSFGLFCKDYKTVEFQAADTLSGIQKIEYLVADKEMTAEELTDATWQIYTDAVNLDATGKYVVYVRVSDKEGNRTEEGISTEGIVIYEDSSVASTASREYNAGAALDVEYFENGNTLKEILYTGEKLTEGMDADYVIAANANVLTFMPAFLDTLEIGTHEFTFVFLPQGVETTAVSLTKEFTLTVTSAPHIENEEGKMGWEAILDEVEDVLAEGVDETVSVDMNGFTEVPGDFFESVKGKDVDVKFDLGNGIVWTVNGKDITGDNLEDIDFAVTISTEEKPINTIPVAIINKVTGENSHMEISLAHNGEFGFTAVLTLNLDAENAGLFANLYYYNVAEQALEFICADEIAADGSADLTFTHASDYTIVIDDEPADAEEPDGVQPPNTGDSTNIIFWCMLLVAGFGMIVFGQRRRVR